MTVLARLARRLRALVNPPGADREMADELAFHLANRTDELIASGLSAAEAARRARLEFGAIERVKEECRDERGFRLLHDLGADVSYAIRVLRRGRGFALVAILSMAIGIGANALVFTVVNGLLLRPLPVDRPDRLVFVQGNGVPAQSYPNYVDFRDRNTTLAGLIGYRIAPMSVDAGGTPSRRWGYLATGNYFDVLGVRPVAGRFFDARDDRQPGAAPLAVLSYDEWQAQYGGDWHAIGSTIRINTIPFTIIGVAPRGFYGTERFYRPAIWVPMMMQAQIEVGNPWLDRRPTFNVWLVGRLKTGITRAQAEANLNAIAAQLARDYPWPNRGMVIRLTEPGLVGSALGTPVRAFTLGVQVLAGLVLLAACANLASLLSARGADRRREMAIRLSIGASRGRLIRQLLTESLVLSIAGGIAGASLAWLLARGLSAWRAPIDIPVQFDVSVDLRVLLFACVVSTLAGVLFGLVPARQAGATDPNAALKGTLGDRRGAGHRAMRDLLVTVQIVFCFVLVSACLLSLRGLQRAIAMPLGFEPHGVTVAAFDLGLAGYDEARGAMFQQRLVELVIGLPGVQSAAYSNSFPLSIDQSRSSIYPEPAQVIQDRSDLLSAITYQVSPAFFRTLGMRLISGRDFDARDTASASPVAVINETFARQILQTPHPIGRRFRFGPHGTPVEVVGVVADAKYETLAESARPAVFSPITQRYQATTVLSVRSTVPQRDLVAAIRNVIKTQNPSLPVYDAKPLQEMLALALFPSRAAALALGTFGLIAIVLASTGVHGLVSYAVSRREREIGIRIAIGAGTQSVLKLILSRTAVLVSAGVVLGSALAMLLGSVLASIIYTASPRDPIVFGGVAALIVTVALLSCCAPALRALRISPTAALKAE